MRKLEKQDIIIIAVCIVFLIGFIVALAVFPKDNNDAIIDETIPETVEVTDSTEPIDPKTTMYENYLDTMQNTEALIITSTELVQETTEKQMIVINELNALKAGDEAMIKKYFGESDNFATDIVADRVAPAEIHFVTNPESSDLIYAHICTLDYHKILNDYLTNSENKITEGILNNNYDVCYTLSLSVNEDNSVNVTEAFKEAITGGWYQSDAEPVDCILG